MFKRVYASIIVIAILIFSLSYYLIEDSLHLSYKDRVKNSQEFLQHLIRDKRSNTKVIATVLSQSIDVKNSLKSGVKVDLKHISKMLKTHSPYKNVWIHLVNSEGRSIQRSWAKKSGDIITGFRLDVVQMLKEPKVMDTISVGKFDMTFKSMVPVYEDNNYLGHVEVITKFNSIAQQMSEHHDNLVILVDKSYKKQIKKPFTKTFLNEYYVANIDAKEELKKTVLEGGIQNFLTIKKFKVINDKWLVSTYHLKDIKNKKMGYFIIFTDLKKIDYQKVESTKKDIIILTGFLITLFLLYWFRSYKNTVKLKEQSKYYKRILDLSNDMVMEINSDVVTYINKRFMEVLHVHSLEDFKERDHCICKLLVDIEGKPDPWEYEAWIAYIKTIENKVATIRVKVEDEIKVFQITSILFNLLEGDKDKYIVFLKDITAFENSKEALENIVAEKVKEIEDRDKIIIQNSKTSAMSQIINEISHQWRQPLNTIGLEVELLVDDYNYDGIDEKRLTLFRDKIMSKIQGMSATINNFMTFFKSDGEKELFDVVDVTEKTIELLEAKASNMGIEISTNVNFDYSCYVSGYRNRFVQVIHNVLTNSIDAIASKDINKDDSILIDFSVEERDIIIVITDNGCGMKEEEVDQIFLPYFSPKSNTGAGIGMFMSKNIIENQFDGTITAENIEEGFKVTIRFTLTEFIRE